MGTYFFGTNDSIRCIQDVSIRGKNNEALCLAYKASTKFYFAGLYVHDDGYVLRSKSNDGSYYNLTDQDVANWQAQSLLPTPLPSYKLPISDYLEGYSLWLCLVVVALLVVFGTRLDKLSTTFFRRKGSNNRVLQLNTKGDIFVAEQARRELASGEVIEQQAYAFDRLAEGLTAFFANPFFAVLTNKRFLFIRTRRGLIAPVLENRGIESVHRSDILKATCTSSGCIELTLRDGTSRTIFVKKTLFGSLSNQDAFAVEVPRSLVTA